MKYLVKVMFGLLLTTVALCTYAQDDAGTDSGVIYTQAEIDQMLAPIALYPDTVLSHVLIASTYPLEVVQAARWSENNSGLSGDDALQAVENKDWDPSVKALVPFPQLLQRMSEDLEWTQALGEAFLQDEKLVLDSVQNMRKRAYDEGNLESLDNMEVSREGDNIVIEPTVREVVYVPYYDTRVVYGPWWWGAYPPVYWPYRGYHYTTGLFVWGPRVFIHSGFYFSSFHWHRRHVVVVDDYHRHSHAFRSSRHVAHYSGASHWRHDVNHRRGVVYRNTRAREQYGDSRRYNNGPATVRASSDARRSVDVSNRGGSPRKYDRASNERRESINRNSDNRNANNRQASVVQNLRDSRTDNRADNNASNRSTRESRDRVGNDNVTRQARLERAPTERTTSNSRDGVVRQSVQRTENTQERTNTESRLQSRPERTERNTREGRDDKKVYSTTQRQSSSRRDSSSDRRSSDRSSSRQSRDSSSRSYSNRERNDRR